MHHKWDISNSCKFIFSGVVVGRQDQNQTKHTMDDDWLTAPKKCPGAPKLRRTGVLPRTRDYTAIELPFCDASFEDSLNSKECVLHEDAALRAERVGGDLVPSGQPSLQDGRDAPHWKNPIEAPREACEDAKDTTLWHRGLPLENLSRQKKMELLARYLGLPVERVR